jgi:hypothetical protein
MRPTSFGKFQILVFRLYLRGVWKVIQGILDPVVASKIDFVTTKTVLAYIDPAQLPPALGGCSSFKYQYDSPTEADKPTVDPAEKQQLEEVKRKAEEEMLEVTRAWLKDPRNAELCKKRDSAHEHVATAWRNLEKFHTRNWYLRHNLVQQ